MAAKTKLLDPIHPGEIFYEEFMKPMGISITRSRPGRTTEPYRADHQGDARHHSRHDASIGNVFGGFTRVVAQSSGRLQNAVCPAHARRGNPVKGAPASGRIARKPHLFCSDGIWYPAVNPPSTTRTAPLMNPACGDARNRAHSATSSGAPKSRAG